MGEACSLHTRAIRIGRSSPNGSAERKAVVLPRSRTVGTPDLAEFQFTGSSNLQKARNSATLYQAAEKRGNFWEARRICYRTAGMRGSASDRYPALLTDVFAGRATVYSTREIAASAAFAGAVHDPQ